MRKVPASSDAGSDVADELPDSSAVHEHEADSVPSDTVVVQDSLPDADVPLPVKLSVVGASRLELVEEELPEVVSVDPTLVESQSPILVAEPGRCSSDGDVALDERVGLLVFDPSWI